MSAAYTAKYKRFGEGLYRPVIDVNLVYNSQNFPTLALIDSGADFCIFDRELGEALGLNVTSGKPSETRGIDGDTIIVY